MNLIIDTHTFLWFVWNDARLSERAKQSIIDPENDIYLSVASVWELGIKVGQGKLTLAVPFHAFVPLMLETNRLLILPVILDHAMIAAGLAPHHKDPFDRMIAAQSLRESMPLVGRDSMFDAYGVERVW